MGVWSPERVARRTATRVHPYLAVPVDWQVEGAAGVGPFPTAVRWRRPDGGEVTWRSRAHRKHPVRPVRRWWWAPRELGWWIGLLFALGSTCFAVASFTPVADQMSGEAVGATFFVGSIFFTTAAFCQYLQTQSAGIDPGSPALRRTGHRLAAEPRRIDWWAAAVQLLGTVYFNLNTYYAMQDGLAARQQDQLIWRPDAWGSICFLVASWLAWVEVCNGSWAWRPRDAGWWTAALNLLGSIAFGFSAVAAWVIPSSDELLNDRLANGGTFVGAVCFLVGAILLWPELRSAPSGTGEVASATAAPAT